MRRFTEEEKSKIEKLFASRNSLDEICKIFNVKSTDTLRRIVGNAGRKIDRIDKEECINLYKEGKTLSRLGTIYNVSPASVRNLLKENNVNLRAKPPKKFSSVFNSLSEAFFFIFDMANKTKGLYGKNEFLIEELGYKPDYFNPNLKLIMEWDEPHHKYQIEEDYKRQLKIMKKYSDFRFIRIKEEDVINRIIHPFL